VKNFKDEIMITLSQVLNKKTKNKLSLLQEKKSSELKLLMLRYQQAAFNSGKKIVILFEGFDASGKGTCIRYLTENLDPRSFKVVPVGPPSLEEKGQHYLQRFWRHLPPAGHVVIFDRSWYGRVLVEKVEKLAPKNRLEEAYNEINYFEKMLKDDGYILMKIFLAVSKKEQLARFEERLNNPFKGWKITNEDVRNRKNWNKYVKASDELIVKCPHWFVIPSDNKTYARFKVLETVTNELKILTNFIPLKERKKRLSKVAQALFKKLS
jgi:polyphosphate kinase 2 (PPK2 family)